MLFTCMIKSNVVLFLMVTLLVFVTYWKYLPSLTTVVIKACFYNLCAFFFKVLKVYKFRNHNLFCNSVMNLTKGEHSSTLFLVLLSKMQLEFFKKRKKFTVIFMPSIISSLLWLSLVCFTSILSTSMFLSWLFDSIIWESSLSWKCSWTYCEPSLYGLSKHPF